MISLGFMGGGGNSVRQGLLKISGGEGGGGKERCIFVFCILNTSLKVFCISNTFQVLYLYLVFQIHFKCCICILYFKYKLHVFDPTLCLIIIATTVCTLSKETGSCSNYTVKWYFDIALGDC